MTAHVPTSIKLSDGRAVQINGESSAPYAAGCSLRCVSIIAYAGAFASACPECTLVLPCPFRAGHAGQLLTRRLLPLLPDYVYLTSSWNPGDAYTVGRIIEFALLPQRVVNYKSVDTTDGGQELYARINTFLRPRDLPVRCSQDPRLLVGTMTADLYTIDSIRGKCTVAHRDWIAARPRSAAATSERKYSVESDPALLAWKEKEHHFFFYQLYERYSQKLFDVLPVEQVTNAPPEVLETLRTRYSFVSTETHGVAGLTNPVRECDKCASWIPITDAVQCDACKKHWHLKCITPRLTYHPMKVRGYRWTCAACTRIHEERVHNEMVSETPIVNSGRSSRSRQSKPGMCIFCPQVLVQGPSDRTQRSRSLWKRSIQDCLWQCRHMP